VLSALCNFARLTRVTVPVAKDQSLSGQQPNRAALRRATPARIARQYAGACAAAVLAVGACWPTQAEESYPLIGRPAPDFALHAATGSNVRMSEHHGDVVVLSFWSSHCSPCRTQLNALDKSLATYRSAGLTILGIGVDDDQGQSRDYARSIAVGFTLLLDPSKGVARSYQVDNLPMTVLIDRGGNVRYVLRDYSSASDELYLQQLRALLNE